MGTIQEVIEKVQKLRRLATSSNVHEAAAAAAAADKLIQEHGLAEAQLEAEGQVPGERPTEEETPLVGWNGRQTVGWQRLLAGNLAWHYDCASYLSFDSRRDGWDFHLIGRPSDIASVRYMYGWLVPEIERLAEDHRGKGRSWLNSFRHGAVAGVSNEMYRSKVVVRKQATSTAIVLVDKRRGEACAERDRRHPDLKTAKPISQGDDDAAFAAGHEAGRNIHQTQRALGEGTRALPEKGGA